MALNSFSFVLFLLGVAIGVRGLARLNVPLAKLALLVASGAFYAFGQKRYLALIVGSILFNSWIARRAAGGKKGWLTFGIVANITLLAAFKYARFGLGVLAPLVPSLHLPEWAFPLGISFFTLQQVMYLVDCYEGLVTPHTLVDHALFVSFFPYITAGPISRSRAMARQFQRFGAGRDLAEDIDRGLLLFTVGVLKKSVLADSLGMLVNVGYATPQAISHTGAWVCSVAYALQIYFDFSGYSDMAMGAGVLLGFDIPKNFDAPFHARSISEFWQRWHITLSQFITTYLYTPLVRRAGRVTVHRAAVMTFVSMTIAGLWHGPSWNYVVFGAIHGVGLAANQYWKKYKPTTLPPVLAWVATLILVNTAFVFFRTTSLQDALHVCRMLLPGGVTPSADFVRSVDTSGVASYLPVWLFALVVVGLEPASKLDFARKLGRLLLGDFFGSRRRYWMVPMLSAITFGSLLLSAGGSGGAPIIYALF